jgi:hypothetical protein
VKLVILTGLAVEAVRPVIAPDKFDPPVSSREGLVQLAFVNPLANVLEVIGTDLD